jgi:transposase-like protein
MNWADLSWTSEGERQRVRSTKPLNRRTVEVITCPTCQGFDVVRRNVTAAKSRWECTAGKGCPSWFETPTTGEPGKAHIA